MFHFFNFCSFRHGLCGNSKVNTFKTFFLFIFSFLRNVSNVSFLFLEELGAVGKYLPNFYFFLNETLVTNVLSFFIGFQRALWDNFEVSTFELFFFLQFNKRFNIFILFFSRSQAGFFYEILKVFTFKNNFPLPFLMK